MILPSNIRLQFSTSGGVFSKVIQWMSAGDVTHVDALWDLDPSGSPQLLGAREDCSPGVRVRPHDYQRFTKRVIFTVNCTTVAAKRWHDFLRSQLGSPYDWKAIVGFAMNRNWRESDSWICSELQARALEVAGITPPLYLPANKITPVALALALSAMGCPHIES